MANLYVPSRQSERYSIAIIGDCEVLRLGLYAALAKVVQTNQIIYLNDIAQLGLNQRRINVAVVDLDAQRTNKVIEQVEQLAKAKVPVVAYQSSEQPYLLRSVCELGVQAVLTRCVSGSELRRAVLEVATGRRLSPVSWVQVRPYIDYVITDNLQGRRRDVLLSYAQGHTAKETSNALGLTVATVNRYTSLGRQTCANNGMEETSRPALLTQAQREGLLC